MADVELSLKGLDSAQEFVAALAAALADELQLAEPFKLFFSDEDGDSVMVTAQTELRELAFSSSITAKVEAPKSKKGAERERGVERDGGGAGKEVARGKKPKASGGRRSGRGAPPPLAMQNDMSD